MKKSMVLKNSLMVRISALTMIFVLSVALISCSDNSNKPNSKFKGVQIGAITYSWRSMPGTPQDIIDYCVQAGISSIELMGNVVEEYAGAPAMPSRPGRRGEMSAEQRDSIRQVFAEAREKQIEWRLSNAPSDKYIELKKMFDNAGINIHIVKFSPANWSDEEIDYAFESAKIFGAEGVSNEIGHEACERLGKFAEKHDMYAIFHNHGQPGDPEFNFEDFLAYSSNNMLNFDVGHYFGATGTHPNELIEKLHNRIFSIHLKDKTAKDADPADTNAPWGEGDTPIEDILKLIQKNKWDIYCDIELEYDVPEDSDAVQETAKLVEYCKNILL